jgi:hypothetical protein
MSIGIRLIIALAGALVVVCVAVVAAERMSQQRRQRERMHQTLGPEYGRPLPDYGSQERAMADLQGRQERVNALTFHPLTLDEQMRFVQAWRATQARFLDEPAQVIAEADRLIADLMNIRGYPVHDFDYRGADLSADYPTVVQRYRAAHAISLASARGEASTEDRRTAMSHYRALFNELLESTLSERPQSQSTEIGR